jgi:hypothetical protein
VSSWSKADVGLLRHGRRIRIRKEHEKEQKGKDTKKKEKRLRRFPQFMLH